MTAHLFYFLADKILTISSAHSQNRKIYPALLRAIDSYKKDKNTKAEKRVIEFPFDLPYHFLNFLSSLMTMKTMLPAAIEINNCSIGKGTSPKKFSIKGR